MARQCWALAGVLPAIGIAVCVAAETPRPLSLLWLDHHELVPDFERVEAETARIFAGMGVVLRWEGENPGEPEPQDGVRVRVVLMPSEPSGWKLPRNALGVVLLPERARQETVYLFYPAILRSLRLGQEANAMLTPRERKDLARAIARVVVHEVVHAIDPDIAHAGAGLMKESLSAAALSRREATVDARSRRAFREGLVLSGRERPTSPRPPE